MPSRERFSHQPQKLLAPHPILHTLALFNHIPHHPLSHNSYQYLPPITYQSHQSNSYHQGRLHRVAHTTNVDNIQSAISKSINFIQSRNMNRGSPFTWPMDIFPEDMIHRQYRYNSDLTMDIDQLHFDQFFTTTTSHTTFHISSPFIMYWSRMRVSINKSYSTKWVDDME